MIASVPFADTSFLRLDAAAKRFGNLVVMVATATPNTSTPLSDDWKRRKMKFEQFCILILNVVCQWPFTHVQLSHISRLSGGSAGIPSRSCHASCSDIQFLSVSKTMFSIFARVSCTTPSTLTALSNASTDTQKSQSTCHTVERS